MQVHCGHDDRFWLFKQLKYAFNEPKLAVVGGFLDPGESPIVAAKRELAEEMSMRSDEWINLGRYRVSANRGGNINLPDLILVIVTPFMRKIYRWNSIIVFGNQRCAAFQE